MRVLIDVSHPALAHVFGHVIPALRARGHETLVVARDKDVTLPLLDAYGIAHQVLAPAARDQRGRLRELLVREARLLALARRFRPDLITGTSVHAAPRGLPDAVPIRDPERRRRGGGAALPLAGLSRWPRPSSRPPRWPTSAGDAATSSIPRTTRFSTCTRIASAPIRRFAATWGSRTGQPYAIVRLSALEAHHDRGVKGVSNALLRALVDGVGRRVRVLRLQREAAGPGVRVPAHRAAAGAHPSRAGGGGVLPRRQPDHDRRGRGARHPGVPDQRLRRTHLVPSRAGGVRAGLRLPAGRRKGGPGDAGAASSPCPTARRCSPRAVAGYWPRRSIPSPGSWTRWRSWLRLPSELRCPAHRLALAVRRRRPRLRAGVPGPGGRGDPAFRSRRRLRRGFRPAVADLPPHPARLRDGPADLAHAARALPGRAARVARAARACSRPAAAPGRFTELLLEAGARVFACDLSRAVEANRENCRQMAGALRLPGRHPRPARRGCRLRPRVVPGRHPAHAGSGGDDPRPGREGEARRAAGRRPLRDAARPGLASPPRSRPAPSCARR